MTAALEQHSFNPPFAEIEDFAVTRHAAQPRALESADILIVEDSAPERARLVAILRKLGYSTKEASNGVEAMNLMTTTEFNLVLSDWHMPVMSGIELCKAINQQTEQGPYLILLTGRSAVCDLVSAMDSGADDYLVKPFNGEELRVRIQAGLRIVNMRIKLARQNKMLETSYQRERSLNELLQQDLKAAVKLQKTTLPKTNETINRISTAYYFQPALGVAGDTFSVIPLGKNHVGFFQVDVVGHGVRAAMLSYAVSRYLHEHSRKPPTGPDSVQMHRPEKVLQSLNQEFLGDDDCNDYFTIVYGVMNTETGAGKLAQAGHPHPKIIDAAGAIIEVKGGGLPIGLFSDASYSATDFVLPKQATLLLYSDGIYECQLASGEPIDNANFNSLLKSLCGLSMNILQTKIAMKINSILSGNMPNDDISLLFLKRN